MEKTGCPLCPVTAVTAYMVQRGTGRGPFFQFAPMTKATFTDRVRAEAGLCYNHFAGHSFRIGAATAAANAGQDSTIRTLGRWNSSAFLSYIATSREQLAPSLGSLPNHWYHSMAIKLTVYWHMLYVLIGYSPHVKHLDRATPTGWGWRTRQFSPGPVAPTPNKYRACNYR